MRRGRIRVVTASTTSSLPLLLWLMPPGISRILDASDGGQATRTFVWRNVSEGMVSS